MANDIISPENLVYKKPTLMNDTTMHYCPGVHMVWFIN